jgi:tRNA-2-methylthio-N6-dimethylallyladenosine synthase
MKNKKEKSYCIVTYGCQMNHNDSERIASFFEKNNLQQDCLEHADIIVFNSCSVRQSATDRLKSKLEKTRKKYPHKTIILAGCVLEEDKKKITPYCDYVLSSQNLSSWPLNFLQNNKEKTDFFEITPKRTSLIAYISIMTGCNNFCSYCVVPYTKGRESSRPANKVLREIKEATKSGYKEIWLLGQNVNSYKGGLSFSELLKEANKIRGDFWLRFASSHPKDFSDEIISAIKNCKKVTNYIHLPLQSGDDSILEKMNRPYTSTDYKNIISSLKEEVPDISISTDIIVGFPGEEEKNFINTLTFFNNAYFDMAYIARYSPRPQTAAYNLKDTVSNEEKRRREKLIEEVLKEKKTQKNKSFLGKKIKVFVLRKNKKGLLVGKTEGYNNVLLEGEENLLGSFVKVEIIQTSSWGLRGKIIKK